jgi:hypothetical protein
MKSHTPLCLRIFAILDIADHLTVGAGTGDFYERMHLSAIFPDVDYSSYHAIL